MDSSPLYLPSMLAVVSAVLSLPTALLLLALYRRAVVRGMRSLSSSAPGAAPCDAAEALPPPTGPAASAVPDSAAGGQDCLSAPTGERPAERASNLWARAQRAPWQLAAIYAAGGAAYTLVQTLGYLAAANLALLPVRFFVIAWTYLWPIVITTILVAATTRSSRARVHLAYWAPLVLVYFLGVIRTGNLAGREHEIIGQMATLWMLNNAFPALLLLAILNRRVRAVGPLVFVFLFTALAGALGVVSVVTSSGPAALFVIEAGEALGLGAGGVLVGLYAVGFLALAVAGGFVLRWIKDLYLRRRLSEQSLMLDCIWLLFTLWHTIQLGYHGAVWLLVGVAALLAFKAVTVAGLRLRARRTAPLVPHPRLLLLRVFALGRRSAALFHHLTLHWRHLGSVRLISGPDLATTTVEPHEFLGFLSGRLHQHFIGTPGAVESRIAEADDAPDLEGRFRVHEFFCRDDTWRLALARLVRGSDVVLMDLRGFSRANAGCLFEIEELVNLVPLNRVLVVSDASTDQTFLRDALAGVWARMSAASPNLDLAPDALPRFEFTAGGRRAAEGLLHRLCAMAESGPARPYPGRQFALPGGGVGEAALERDPPAELTPAVPQGQYGR